MKYTLVQFRSTETKGHYEAIAYTTYDNPLLAFNDGMKMHRKLTPPYAGFLVRDEKGHTLHRVRKENR